jgi:hypothetical protein
MITKMEPIWEIKEALEFIRTNQNRFNELNFHLGIAGSVLNNEQSFNDLDIIVMPMYNDKYADEIRLTSFLITEFKASLLTDDEYITEGRIMFRTLEPKKIDWFVFR